VIWITEKGLLHQRKRATQRDAAVRDEWAAALEH
jgi:hypothetical protein